MSNPKGSTLPNALSMYFVMLAIYCIDIFLFQTDLTVLGDAFFSRFFSFVILFLYVRASKDTLSVLGVSKKRQKFIAGGVYGALFSLVPLLLVMAGEVVYLISTGDSTLNLIFSPPSINYVRTEGYMTPVTVTAIYIATTFLGSAFKEFFFRGFMLKKMNKVMSFAVANILQSLLYMSFILPSQARNFFKGYYNETTTKLAVFIIAFYIIHETLAGVKWGLMTRVSGSTYIATVDHFLYVFFSNSIFITSRYETWTFMLHMLAIQLVSFLMVIVYYAIGMKKINAKKLREKAEEEEARQRKEARKKEREANRVLREKIEPLVEISPESFKSLSAQAHSSQIDTEDSNTPLESTVFIEDAINEKPTESEDSDIDDFLKKVTRDMRRAESHTDAREITEDFDSDEFLKAYQSGGSHGQSRHHRHHHRNHHHHSESDKSHTPQKVETTVPTPKKKMAKKPKKSVAQVISGLGGVDTSSSNDLI